MLRDARPGDEAAIDAFLARHAETSMFLRANLRRYGLDDRDAPHATRFWLAGTSDIDAVFGLSNAGFAMMQAPGAADQPYDAFARLVRGRRLAGLTGVPDQLDRAKRALGVDGTRYGLDSPEPLYRLDLARLAVPGGPGALRPVRDADRATITAWTRAYSAELHMSSPETLDAEAKGRADRAMASGDVRLLVDGDKPLAMTAFNARLPDMVQIGGVYTPPALRGRGHARRAVALHVAEARAEGVKTAILFASGPAACRAYEAIGFSRIGAYGLSILAQPLVIGGPQ